MTRHDLKLLCQLHRDITSLRSAQIRIGNLLQSAGTDIERESLRQTLKKIESQLAAAIESSMSIESTIVAELLLLPPPSRAVMIDRFINGKSIDQTARDNCLSQRSVYRVIRNSITYINSIT